MIVCLMLRVKNFGRVIQCSGGILTWPTARGHDRLLDGGVGLEHGRIAVGNNDMPGATFPKGSRCRKGHNGKCKNANDGTTTECRMGAICLVCNNSFIECLSVAPSQELWYGHSVWWWPRVQQQFH